MTTKASIKIESTVSFLFFLLDGGSGRESQVRWPASGDAGLLQSLYGTALGMRRAGPWP